VREIISSGTFSLSKLRAMPIAFSFIQRLDVKLEKSVVFILRHLIGKDDIQVL
jgi:hypothetical protein